MYNNFLVEKKRKIHDKEALIQKRKTIWIEKYHTKIQPHLLDKYNQRINSFISKQIQENPLELEKYQANDIKKEKEEHLKQQISELSRKGGKIFKFRDATDFSSFFNEAERIQRQKNRLLFERKYGDSNMAYRSIASQSDYNPQLLNEYRHREKSKEINPPMRYISKLSSKSLAHRKTKSVADRIRKGSLAALPKKPEQAQHDQILRKTTSHSHSFMGTEDFNRSMCSKQGSQSSQDSHKNLKKISVTLQSQTKQKKRQSNKSYFVGITDIKQNSRDPHLKKTLHNVLVKIGKNHPNPRDRNLMSQIQVLSNDIN